MPNFQNYLKRLYLNRNLRRLHELSESYLPMMTAPYDKQRIWNSVNCLLQAPRKGVQEAKIEQVRRCLFREPKKRSRKLKKPKRKTILFSECVYFKVYRHLVGKQKIRRNFSDIPRPQLCIEQLDEEILRDYSCRDKAQPRVRAVCTSMSRGKVCKRCKRNYLLGLVTSDSVRSRKKQFEEAGRFMLEIKTILSDYVNITVDDGA